jgi:hypothetical protein
VDAQHSDKQQPADLEYGRSKVQYSIVLKNPAQGVRWREEQALHSGSECRQEGHGQSTYVTNLTSFRMRATRKMRRIFTTRITLALLLVVATAD